MTIALPIRVGKRNVFPKCPEFSLEQLLPISNGSKENVLLSAL